MSSQKDKEENVMEVEKISNKKKKEEQKKTKEKELNLNKERFVHYCFIFRFALLKKLS